MTFEEIGGWRSILVTLTEGRDLTSAEAHAAMTEVLEGRAEPAQIAGFIIALRMKGESVTEVVGLVDAMLGEAEPIEVPAGIEPVDIVGTGGAPNRRAHALNVSTMACFVAAGAGAPVLKHGNLRASSTSGSFDLLDALGIPGELDGPAVIACLTEAGLGFCFARLFHRAMRHAGPVRAELGVPTVFNVLGPLSHPAHLRRQVIGVADAATAPTVIGVLQARGAHRAMVVHGHDGMDELTITGRSTVHELRDGTVTTYELDPAELGIEVVPASAVEGGDPRANVAIFRRILSGESGPYRDIVTLNAAAGLVVAGLSDTMADGLAAAGASIDSGAAAQRLEALIDVANR